MAAGDTYGLYNENMADISVGLYGMGCNIQRTGSAGSYGYSVAADWADRPVNYISWGDATRFSNWLHNGQPTGAQELSTTENGSYFLNGAMTDADLLSIIRESDATWVIPTEDEWYKAAYYNPLMGGAGGYYMFPTASDEAPDSALINPDPGNNANFLGSSFTIGEPYWRTEVGEFENSPSPYGTFDQGGNVWEWNETALDSGRGMRGGSFGSGFSNLDARIRFSYDPTGENSLIGFRIAEVPEPATVILLALGSFAVIARRRIGAQRGTICAR